LADCFYVYSESLVHDFCPDSVPDADVRHVHSDSLADVCHVYCGSDAYVCFVYSGSLADVCRVYCDSGPDADVFYVS
jgi:hypothetical protein